MLLLLRTPAGLAAAASVGLTLGLSAGGSSVTASVGITLGLTPPESIEIQLLGLDNIAFGLSGVPVGFQAGSASVGSVVGLTARGGFGAVPVLPINLGLSGTVGSFFDGIGTVGILHGLTGAPVTAVSGSLSTVLGLQGTPIISGGTISSAASMETIFGLSSASHALGSAGLLTLALGFTGSGFVQTASVVESMILTFTADSVRTFFRKK